jgi:UDP-N-acetylmuramoyl-L-alanyl-D-glutamate--2,6-diaminopimelate ligase
VTGTLAGVSAPIPLRPTTPVETPLREVAARLGPALLDSHGDVDATVLTGVTMSSLRVCPGDLYVAPAGARAHGASYAAGAVEDGAVAVLTDPEGAGVLAEAAIGSPGPAVPVLVVESPRAVVGDLAARVYGRPAERMRLVGVTGTQGKTTTTRLAEASLTAAGIASAVVGTVGTRMNGVEVKTSLTTPEAPDLHALFAVMVERDVVACAMEVSSHALVMGRVDGVVFDVACFLNLGRDHLDFHADLEDYFAAKASLFTPQRCRRGLVNVDDEHGRRLAAEATVPTATFSVRDSAADWHVSDVALQRSGSTFTVHAPSGRSFPVRVPLPGDFNVANALCAVAAVGEAGFDPEPVAAAMGASGGVPGRLEQVDAGQDFLAVVDYAHKPDAVSAALAALRPLTAGRLILVIGAGGDRDPGKRPMMGEIAARLADVVVVTDDNPRSEDPAAIRAELGAGARAVPEPERADLREVGDRRAAIRLAAGMARPGDTVVVAGKGHETGQEVAGRTYPFDDRQVLLEELGAR